MHLFVAGALSTSQSGVVHSLKASMDSALSKWQTQSIHGALPVYYITTVTHCSPLLPAPSADEDFFEITEYLMDMEKTAVYNLGLVLGLSQRKLKANIESKSFLDDVISAWLRREDQVIKRGEPSWTVLISALMHRRVQQTGIATKIAKDNE